MKNFKNQTLNLLKEIINVKKSEYYSKDQLKKLQRKRFEDLALYAMKNSKFYREFYNDHNINEESLFNKGYYEFPTLNKKILMENFPSIITQKDINYEELEEFLSKENTMGKLYKNKYYAVHTSGSSGKIGIFIYDQKGWNTIRALVISRVSNIKIKTLKKYNFTFIGATSGHFAGISLAASVPKELFRFNPVNINAPTEEIIKKINNEKPYIISGYSSGIYMLSKLQKENQINISPKEIVCSADPLTPGMKNEIYKAFKVEARNFYASSESICMGGQKGINDNMYLFNDFHVFELLDRNNNYIHNRRPGRMIMTNLYNYTEPIIRYEMNDELIINDQIEAPEKWNFPVLEKISGRSEEVLWFKKKNNKLEYIHPLVFVEFYVPGLEKFQIIQKNSFSFEVDAVINTKIHPKEIILSTMNKKLSSILKEKKLDNDVKFTIILKNKIDISEKTGKSKLIIPLPSNNISMI